MNHQSKYVALDIGNVLFHVYLEDFYNFLLREEIFETIEETCEFCDSIQPSLDLGIHTIKESFHLRLGITGTSLRLIHEKWLDIVRPSGDMLDLIDDLLVSGYHVALLSNIGFDHAAVVRDKCNVFNKCIQHFSCDVGARKPTKLFFQSFILDHDWSLNDKKPFFDDRRENVKASQPYLLGMHFDIRDHNSDKEAAELIKSTLHDIFS